MKKGSKKEQPKAIAIPKAIALLTSDEWDDAQYYISNEFEFLEEIAIKKHHLKDIRLFHNHILSLFEREIKEMLIETGFEKVMLEDPDKLHKIIKALDRMGIEYKFPRYELPYGFPEGILKIRQDKKVIWVKPEIESALRALESINLMTKELSDKKSIIIFLKSFELLVNVLRAGCMNPILSEIKKQENRAKTMEIYENHISAAIERVFRKYPKYKTLDQLWRHFNSVNAEGVFTNPKSKNKKKDMYKLKIETDSQTKKEVLNIYIYILDSENEVQLKLLNTIKKRSLQKYIDKYKATSKITQ
jgi:hypothetical protein